MSIAKLSRSISALSGLALCVSVVSAGAPMATKKTAPKKTNRTAPAPTAPAPTASAPTASVPTASVPTAPAAQPNTISNTTMQKQVSESTAEKRKIIRENQGVLGHSVARQWNEVLLDSIRKDYARPTVHARNLYHTSSAMWDAWAAYDTQADQVLHNEKRSANDVQAARQEAMSYAMYRLLRHRFADSPARPFMYPEYDLLMAELGYDTTVTTLIGNSPAALGNRIASTIIAFGMTDGANEIGGYDNLYYEPINPPLYPDFPGNPDMIDFNRWQPLVLEYYVDQSGNPSPSGEYPGFLSPEWGDVIPFSLNENDFEIMNRDGRDWAVWHNPGPPPYFGTESEESFKWGNEMVVVWSSHLDPTSGVMIDISPGGIGNAPLATVAEELVYYDFMDGGDWGDGWDINPTTGEPYEPQIVPLGDYARILAEFWADGPDSETPPGHWFSVMNYVGDHPLFEKRFMGQGPILDDLEWDVKSYLVMGGSMHDCAVAAWSVKGYYDYLRPVSAIRFMCDLGQSSDAGLPSYNPGGIRLIPEYIELVTAESTAPGQRHEHLLGSEGKIAIKAWLGPTQILDPDTDVAGVGWMLGENWWPYQRPSFVSPPFAGYVSGHSVFSRSAAEVMTLLTGTPFFPGGMGEFEAPMNEFLVFEDGPSMDITLQWATYQDASDQTSLSRIWGGIHPPADDLPGRHMGQVIGPEAFTEARRFFRGLKSCPGDYSGDGVVDYLDISLYVQLFINNDQLADTNRDNVMDINDIFGFIDAIKAGCP